MGATSSRVTVKSGTPSPSVLDGRLSVVSDALDDFVDFERFWTELINLIKAPGQLPFHVRTFLKFQGSELVEDSGANFKTVETYGGVKATRKHFVDKANSIVITETRYEGEREEVDNKVILIMHKDPMRIECWGEKTERVSNMLRFDTMMGTLIRGIRGYFARSKAQLFDDAESRDGSGARSCLSEPLDEHGAADDIFEALVQYHRSAPKRDYVVRTEVVDASEEEFTVVEEYPAEVVQSLFKRSFAGELGSTRRRCSVDREHRRLTMELRLQDGTHVATGYAVIHDGPVQFEFWHVLADGTRESGDRAGFALEMLDAALGREGAFRGLARAHCASRVKPGERSAMSDPLDSFGDFDSLWGRISRASESSVDPPDWAESQELVGEDKESGERKYKILVDDGREVLRRVVVDVEGGRLRDAFSHEGVEFECRCLVMHKDPLQLEYWEDHVDGGVHTRRSGPFMKARLQDCLGSLLGYQPPREIGFRAAESPGNPKLRSVLSDPLGDVADFDFLWDMVLFCICSMKPRDLLTKVDIVDVKSNAFVFKEHYRESFTQTFGRGPDFFTLCILHHEKDRGMITTMRQFNDIRFKHHVKIHREPLRIEMWQDYEERRHGEALRALCQVYVDEILRRVGKASGRR